jgi:hypothetical protein
VSRVTCQRSPNCEPVKTTRTLSELEAPDITELTKAGWRPPEVFTSLARDGKTDIWESFQTIEVDPLKKYSRHREHLRRAAGFIRSQDLHRLQVRCRPSQNLDS